MTDPITIVGGLVLLGLVLGPVVLGAMAVWRWVDQRRRRPSADLEPCRSKVSPLRGADDDILGWLQRADCGESRLFDTQEEACSAAGEHASASRERACTPTPDPIGDDQWRERAASAEPEAAEPDVGAEPTATAEPVEAPAEAEATADTEVAEPTGTDASTEKADSTETPEAPEAPAKPAAAKKSKARAKSTTTSEDSVTTGSA